GRTEGGGRAGAAVVDRGVHQAAVAAVDRQAAGQVPGAEGERGRAEVVGVGHEADLVMGHGFQHAGRGVRDAGKAAPRRTAVGGVLPSTVAVVHARDGDAARGGAGRVGTVVRVGNGR